MPIVIELDASQATAAIDEMTAKVDALQAKVNDLKESLSGLFTVSGKSLMHTIQIETDLLGRVANRK